jgi:Uma2 family endonuclease
MTQTPVKRLTFEEYLNYNDGTDQCLRYEFVNGQLIYEGQVVPISDNISNRRNQINIRAISMPPATGKHSEILRFLYGILTNTISNLGLNWIVCYGDVAVHLGNLKSRIPDLCIISEEQRQSIRLTSAILQSPPVLVVEVVSPSTITTDYRHKRSEYAAIEIPEYWIVDPLINRVSILVLVDGLYEVTEFEGNQQIISAIFPGLVLTAQQILDV